MSSLALALSLLVAPPAELPARERIDALEIDASGRGGQLHMIPEMLGGLGRTVRFGAPSCGAAIAPAVLEVLVEAMHDRRPLELYTTRKGSEQCLVRAKLFSPP